MNKTLQQAVRLMHPDYKHVLEFGVYKGVSLKQLRKNLTQEYSLYGFDSFEGLPEHWTGTKTYPKQFSTGGVIPKISGVKFYKGWFVDTLPEYLTIAEPIALLHVDCDLYSSTVTVLEALKDFIVAGTVIVFDEWYYNHRDIEANRQHEQKAFYEWVERYQIDYEVLPEIEEERRIVLIK